MSPFRYVFQVLSPNRTESVRIRRGFCQMEVVSVRLIDLCRRREIMNKEIEQMGTDD
jgi:hypothetical protein